MELTITKEEEQYRRPHESYKRALDKLGPIVGIPRNGSVTISFPISFKIIIQQRAAGYRLNISLARSTKIS
jgi:hypothetical protein